MLALALVLLAGPAPATPAEVRGLWVVRTGLVSPVTVDRTVDEAKSAGFNTLFVQVRGRGDAFYRSRLAPRSLLLSPATPGFDPLARLLERAHGAGLQVHAWVNVLLAAHFTQPLPAGHLLREHPDWVMVPRRLARQALSARGEALLDVVRGERGRADVEGLYLTPSAPGLAESLEETMGELLRAYDVDGVHLDFIRYPNAEYDYSRAALEGFRKGSAGSADDLLEGPRRDPQGWDDYRRRVLTDLVERLSRTVRAVRPGLPISAAVIADGAEAERYKFQSWAAWAQQGLLDALCPMVYTPDRDVFRRQLVQAVAEAGPTPVWAGIGAYRLEVPGIVENVWAARRYGAAGVVLFSHESLAVPAQAKLRALVFDSPLVFREGGAPGARPALLSGTERQ